MIEICVIVTAAAGFIHAVAVVIITIVAADAADAAAARL